MEDITVDGRVNSATRKNLVRKQACFKQLTDDEVDVLASLFEEVTFRHSEIIVQEGEPVDSVFIIAEGTATVWHEIVEDAKIKRITLAALRPTEAIGLNETGFYSLTGIRTASVEADSKMLLLKLSVPRFNGFALTHPHVSAEMRKYAETVLNKEF